MKYFGFIFLFLIQIGLYGQQKARFVWKDAKGEGRQQYVFFRYDVDLTSRPDSAVLNVFADSYYQLFVNGYELPSGPARFYPAHPEYDTHQITRYLAKGKNTIALKVLSNGMNTYQVPANQAGFISWGSIYTSNGTIDLATPGNWKQLESKGYDPSSPKMSFALGAVESYDTRKDPSDWNLASGSSANWKPVVVLKNQQAWGTLTPRSIPFLTHEPVVAKQLLSVHTLQNSEQIWSFRVLASDITRTDFDTKTRAFMYTYLYSPVDQTVNAGLWWGEFWLNNEALKQSSKTPDRSNQSLWVMNLKKGWNLFFVKYDLVWAHWDFYLSLPKSCGVVPSAVRDTTSNIQFYNTRAFSFTADKAITQMELPIDPVSNKLLKKQWQPVLTGTTAGNPAWDMAWARLGNAISHNPSQQLVSLSGSDAYSLVYDMGGKQLGRLFTDVTVPEGAMVDIGFAEDLNSENRPWVLKRSGIYSGTRFVAREGFNHLETYKPYGSRYVEVIIRNTAGKPVQVHQTGAIRTVYPHKLVGSFECSDPMFNALWQLGWRTLRVCSEDSYTDTPFRERGLYAGDVMPEYAITLVTSGDSRLLKRCVNLFQDMYANLFTPNIADKSRLKPEGDFPVITQFYFDWMSRATNDTAYARQLYPNYKQLMEIMLSKPEANGLYWVASPFIEWTNMPRQNMSSTAMNAYLYQALISMSRMAARLGYTTDQQAFAQKATALKQALITHCYQPSAGRFIDGYKSDQAVTSTYPTSTGLPMFFGILEQPDSLVYKFLKNEIDSVQLAGRNGRLTPYTGFYMLGGMYKAGFADLAEQMMRKCWAPMILHGDDTAWEDFWETPAHPDQSTLSHAWSGSPTYYLSTQVLGVQLGFPEPISNDTVWVCPQTETISWARGTVPHPAGLVKVDWHLDGDYLEVQVVAPKGVTVMVQPKGKLAAKKLITKIEQ